MPATDPLPVQAGIPCRCPIVLSDAFPAGPCAAGHLEGYDAGISANFELALHIGKLVAQCDAPEFSRASAASLMRPGDYVVGIVVGDEAVAFPMWVADNYHVINCEIAGQPIVYVTCERCQSGSAFLPVVQGRAVQFSAMGMYNASLTMTDRAGILRRPGSLWLHYEGVAIDGPSKGTFLPQIPTWHLSWSEWLELHPDSLVMLPPRDEHHRDARHGHGREEYFERPGMDRPLVQTITGDLDARYPENEIVLGINVDGFVKAYPLKEVKRSNGVVHDRIGDAPFVVFGGPRPAQVTLAAYSCACDGRALSFERQDNRFIDHQTRSLWTIEGLSVDGPLRGSRLRPIRGQYVRWHAWFYPHRGTALYRHPSPCPAFPSLRPGLDVTPFQQLLHALAGKVAGLQVDYELPGLSLPHEAIRGVRVLAGEAPLNLFQFHSITAAEDYVTFQGAWFCQPIGPKVGRKYSIRLGNLVLESDPPLQYADVTQFVRLPDPQIRWSALLKDPDVLALSPALTDRDQASLASGFASLVRHLRGTRYDVVEAAFLPHSQLPVGAESALAATINSDRFAIYRFSDGATAERSLAVLPHSLAMGRWIFRSIPVLMYREPCYEMGQLPEEDISWSYLLVDERFRRCIEAFVSNTRSPATAEKATE